MLRPVAAAAGPPVASGARAEGVSRTVRVHERRTMSVTKYRRLVAVLVVAVLALIHLASPAHALSPCGSASRAGSFAQLPGGRPLADPIPHIPINGTAGFVVPGANT